MAYTPLNSNVFIAAFAGALAGIAVAGKVLSDTTATDYAGVVNVAGAYAQSFDTAWGTTAATTLDVQAIQEESEATWADRTPSSVTPSSYTSLCQALIATIQQAETYLTAQGIVPSQAGAGSAFVWAPGATAGKGIYTTWAALFAAVSSTNGIRNIYVDSSLGAAGALGLPTAFIPVGTWNFNPTGINGIVNFVGKTSSAAAPTCVQATAGATSVNGVGGMTDVLIDNRSTVDLFTMAGANAQFRMAGSAIAHQSTATGGTAFLKCATAGNVVMSEQAVFETFDGGTNAVQGAGSVLFLLNDQSTMNANMISLSTNPGVVMGPGATYATQTGITAQPTGQLQRGTTTLVTGKSPAIVANVKAGSTITFDLITPNTTANTGKYAALTADKVNGVLGSFKITAILAAGDTINVADVSTLAWSIQN